MKIQLKDTVHEMTGNESAHELRDLIAELTEMWDELEAKPSLTQKEVVRRDEIFEEAQTLKAILYKKERAEAEASRAGGRSVIPEYRGGMRNGSIADVINTDLRSIKEGRVVTAQIDNFARFLRAEPVPRQQRATGVLDPASYGGANVIPTPLFGSIYLQSRSNTAFLSELTMNSTENGTKYAYVARDATGGAQNKSYTASLTETTDTLSQYQVSFVNHYAYRSMHNDMLRDGIANLGQETERGMAIDIAQSIASQVLTGDGTSNSMTGIVNYSGVNTTDFSGAELSANGWVNFSRWAETLGAKNVNLSNLSCVMSYRNWAELCESSDSTGQPEQMHQLLQALNIRIYATSLMPDAQIIFGDLSRFTLHYWRGAEMEMVGSDQVKIAQDHFVVRGLTRVDLKSPEPDHVLIVNNVGTTVS